MLHVLWTKCGHKDVDVDFAKGYNLKHYREY